MPRVSCGIPAQRHHVGVERHHRRRSAIGREHLRRPRDQSRSPSKRLLSSIDQGHAAVDQVAQLGERQHPVGGGLERDAPERRRGQRGERVRCPSVRRPSASS